MEPLDVKSLFKPKKKLIKASASAEAAPAAASAMLEETPALPVLNIEAPELKTPEAKPEEKKTMTWGAQASAVETPKPVEEEKPKAAAAPVQAEAPKAPTRYVPPSLRRADDSFSSLSAAGKSTGARGAAMPTLAESMKELERTKTVTAAKTSAAAKPKTVDAEEQARKELEKEERKRQLQEELARAAEDKTPAAASGAAAKEVVGSPAEIAAKYANREKTGRKLMLVF